MKLKLNQLKPNPFRDFIIDPVDPKAQKALEASIGKYGFWSGTVARKRNGVYEVAAGWTRVKAAIEKNETEADICVADFDDQAMVHAYVTENATQRGNSATAITGAVATAIVQIAKLLIINADNLSTFVAEPTKARGIMMQGDGIGAPLIESYLKGVPGINSYVVKDQIALLKSSGQYQRLMKEIAQGIKVSHASEAPEVARLEKELAEAEKGSRTERSTKQKLANKPLYVATKTEEKVSNEPATFDIKVSQVFETPALVKTFKEIAAKPGVQPYLPVKNQVPLAEKLVALAKEEKHELSSAFIRDNMVSLLSEAKLYERKLSETERKELEAQDVRLKFDRLSSELSRNFRSMSGNGAEMLALMAKHRTTTFNITSELRNACRTAAGMITKLAAKL